MRFSNLLVGLAASALVATPALANPASSLSVANARAVKSSTPSKKANKLSGDNTIIAVAATAAIVAGIVAIAQDDDDSDSN